METMACRKVTGEKVTVDEGVTMGQEMIEADATGGKTKGKKELSVDNKDGVRKKRDRKERNRESGRGKSQQPGR